MMEKETISLGDLLNGISYQANSDIQSVQIHGIASDSRDIQAGDLFIAVVGLSSDGHYYIPEALARGCSAILADRRQLSPEMKPGSVPIIEVEDSRTALGLVAANYYGHPARKLQMIGVTGTNGKTTTSYLIEAVIKAAGGRPGVIGTVNYRYTNSHGEEIEQPASFTTPEPITLHRLLGQMADNGITHVVMEVSSHALAQKRIDGLIFNIAAFTNLSRDHLDFHGDMDNYFSSKKRLFCEYLSAEGQAVVMLERATQNKTERNGHPVTVGWGQKLTIELNALPTDQGKNKTKGKSTKFKHLKKIISCGLEEEHDVHPEQYSYGLRGIQANIATPLGFLHIESPLVGEFNLKNLLAATGIGIAMKLNRSQIRDGLSGVKGIPGRLEKVKSKRGTTVFVDYAHTPDALENVLTSLRKLKPGRLICVFGCGGDRDPGKRPIMGETAGRLCDVVLVTSDNPRTEKPEKIMAEIETGLIASPLSRLPAELLLKKINHQGYDLIISRREAISTAIQFSQPGDVVLISGKGHENYQITNAGKIFFDDRLEVIKFLRGDEKC